MSNADYGCVLRLRTVDGVEKILCERCDPGDPEEEDGE